METGKQLLLEVIKEQPNDFWWGIAALFGLFSLVYVGLNVFY